MAQVYILVRHERECRIDDMQMGVKDALVQVNSLSDLLFHRPSLSLARIKIRYLFDSSVWPCGRAILFVVVLHEAKKQAHAILKTPVADHCQCIRRSRLLMNPAVFEVRLDCPQNPVFR